MTSTIDLLKYLIYIFFTCFVLAHYTVKTYFIEMHVYLLDRTDKWTLLHVHDVLVVYHIVHTYFCSTILHCILHLCSLVDYTCLYSSILHHLLYLCSTLFNNILYLFSTILHYTPLYTVVMFHNILCMSSNIFHFMQYLFSSIYCTHAQLYTVPVLQYTTLYSVITVLLTIYCTWVSFYTEPVLHCNPLHSTIYCNCALLHWVYTI